MSKCSSAPPPTDQWPSQLKPWRRKTSTCKRMQRRTSSRPCMETTINHSSSSKHRLRSRISRSSSSVFTGSCWWSHTSLSSGTSQYLAIWHYIISRNAITSYRNITDVVTSKTINIYECSTSWSVYTLQTQPCRCDTVSPSTRSHPRFCSTMSRCCPILEQLYSRVFLSQSRSGASWTSRSARLLLMCSSSGRPSITISSCIVPRTVTTLIWRRYLVERLTPPRSSYLVGS